jgi:hypothetical protein
MSAHSIPTIFAASVTMLACKGQAEDPAAVVPMSEPVAAAVQAEPQPPPVAAAVQAEPQPQPPPKPHTVNLHKRLAVFKDARLMDCIEGAYSLTGLQPSLDVSIPHAEKDLELFITDIKDHYTPTKPKKGRPTKVTIQELSKPCRDTFKGRLVIATCDYGAINAEQAERPSEIVADLAVSLRIIYYDFGRVTRNDELMLECLKANASWEALDRDSDEFRRARREYNASGLRDTANDLRDVLGR